MVSRRENEQLPTAPYPLLHDHGAGQLSVSGHDHADVLPPVTVDLVKDRFCLVKSNVGIIPRPVHVGGVRGHARLQLEAVYFPRSVCGISSMAGATRVEL
jgi:hypothetical protein